MNRRTIAWMFLLAAMTGCQVMQRDAEVTQQQWEPDVDTTAAAHAAK